MYDLRIMIYDAISVRLSGVEGYLFTILDSARSTIYDASLHLNPNYPK
ncbi:MAG TPA: hypothetical protein VLA71_00900 [Algoriphagus sp.]|nr:hypothetical protein [Algoriphagus sp.]